VQLLGEMLSETGNRAAMREIVGIERKPELLDGVRLQQREERERIRIDPIYLEHAGISPKGCGDNRPQALHESVT
jgi:hypothetical protein